MNKRHKSKSASEKRRKFAYKEDEIPTEEEVMSRPGTRDVLRVFHGWKEDKSEAQESRTTASE